MAQNGQQRVQVDARVGAKVNVRSEPLVTNGNVVGKANGGDFAFVLETTERPPYVWYRVRDPNGNFEGWIRGDLISLVAAEDTQAAAPTENVETAPQPQSPATVATVEKQRPRWVEQLPNYLEAARACVRTGSAQPAAAADLRVLQRGLIEFEILDAAERQWKCIVRETGGTPLRFDPMFNSGDRGRLRGPYFVMIDRIPFGLPDCGEPDLIAFPESGEIAGRVIYTDCP